MFKFKHLSQTLYLFTLTLLTFLRNRICAVWVKVTQSCPALCDPMDCSPPGYSVHGILQARILERITILFSRGSSPPRDRTWVSRTAGGFFTIWATRETTRILEWVAILFSRGSSKPRDWTRCHLLQTDSLFFEATGKLFICIPIPQKKATCIIIIFHLRIRILTLM